MPIVQRELLDTVAEPERHKKFKLTVKKVKSTMIGTDEFPMFTADDLGKFKVIITPSKKTEDETFEEEMMKLMEKHGKTVADVRIFCDNFAGE
jgi:C4-type Zn-finger protein